ncbi:MAG: hypothetical protein INR73_19785 [Williamsia sp.]|nr:hypothetical protein [Williamsia sp.]
MKTVIYSSILLLFAGCTKQIDQDLTKQNAASSQAISPKQTSVYDGDDDDEGEGRKYTEYACTVNNKPGTKCDDTKGKCKQKDCEAVASNTIVGDHLSEAEISMLSYEHAKRLVKEGYIDQRDFELSRSVAEKALKMYSNK